MLASYLEIRHIRLCTGITISLANYVPSPTLDLASVAV